MSKAERFAPHALGVAIFLAVAGLALAPTVDAGRSSARAVPKKSASVANPLESYLSSFATTTTVDPRLDPTPTVPPPEDLGAVVVDTSDLGFRRLADPTYDAPFDVSSLPGTSSSDRVTRLTGEGFSRGYLRVTRTDDRLVLEIDVYEFGTNAGATNELGYHRDVVENDPTADRVSVADVPASVGYRYDDVQPSATYHQLVVASSTGARYYRVSLTSQVAPPDLELASAILARQVAA